VENFIWRIDWDNGTSIDKICSDDVFAGRLEEFDDSKHKISFERGSVSGDEWQVCNPEV